MKLMRSILLEGPDGSGKSRLHNTMVSWGLPSSGHDGGPPANGADAWERLAWFAARSPCVRDRSPCVSDIIYSHVFGRALTIDEEDYKTFLVYLKPTIVYCRPPTAIILQQPVKVREHKPKEHVEAVIKQRRELVEAYDLLLSELVFDCELPIYIYDWTKDPTAEELLKDLQRSATCVG